MKVLFDHQIFSLQQFGGISNYFVQLIKNLPDDVQYNIAIKESNNIHLKDSTLLDVVPALQTIDSFITKNTFLGKGKLYRLYSSLFQHKTSYGRNLNASIDAIKDANYDVFHPTFFSDYFLPYLGRKPFVLTIHDMTSEMFSNSCGRLNMQVANMKRLTKQAAHIIAVSENTKSDVIDILHVPESKISVIYHAAPDVEIERLSKPLVEGNYILYVGNREGYKNFIPMISELDVVLKARKDVKIVCTGNPFNKKELSFFERLNIKNQIVHVCPSDWEMSDLYTHAICFIYPSLYEGFGIPILEAWQAGCPVLLNNKSCFPEIAKDAAIFFNLDENSSNLAEVMGHFLQMDDREKEILYQKQQKRLKDFSWKKSAEQLAYIYKMVK